MACRSRDKEEPLEGPEEPKVLVETFQAYSIVHACSLDLEGRISCMGPEGCNRPPSRAGYRTMSLSDSTGCALRSDGEVDCWDGLSEPDDRPSHGGTSVLESSHNDLHKVIDLRVTPLLPGNALCLLDNRGLVQCSDGTMVPPTSPFGDRTIRGIYYSSQNLLGITEEGEFLRYECSPSSGSEGETVECFEPELVSNGSASEEWLKILEADGGTSFGLLYPDGGVSYSPPSDERLDFEERYVQVTLHHPPQDRYGSFCGVTLDGALSCESKSDEPFAEDIQPLPEGEFVQLGTAYGVACALTPELEMVCWGDLLEEIPIGPCTGEYSPMYETGD
jgi:hypothetical protein